MSQSFSGDYFLSLPERMLRSAAAVTGGASLLLTKTLLPDIVKESTTYRVTIGDMQRFLITRLAQVEPVDAAGMRPVTDEYLVHKMAGNVLELASFMAFRFSPVWAFAIVADAAGGSSLYFERLVERLKDMGVIDQDADLNNVQELFDAIQQASSSSAMAIDRPPLSPAELNKMVDDLRIDYGRLGSSSLNLMPRVEKIQEQMEEVSKRENVTLDELSDVMALEASSVGSKSLNVVLAVGKTTTEFIDEQILNSYARTLNEINKIGLPKYTTHNLEPYFKSALDHLDPAKGTWTEKKVAEFLGLTREPEIVESEVIASEVTETKVNDSEPIGPDI